MSELSDTADDHSIGTSSSDLLSGSDSDTLGEEGVTYTHVEESGRTMSAIIHRDRIIKYEESLNKISHALPPSALDKYTMVETEKRNNGNRPRTTNVNESDLAHTSLGKLCKSISSPHVGLETLTINDEIDEKEFIRPELRSSPAVMPIETKGARMSISSTENRYIHKYLLQERLGRGCFGIVRKCKDITTGKIYAMKILNIKILKSQLKYTWTENNKMQTSSMFDSVQQEISIMKRLRHRNILNLIEIIHSDEVLYLILEYMAHGSLARAEQEGNHKIKKICCENNDKLRRYMRDMVSGLAYLHSQRICHSDIKPENILIGENDVLKLADFGISRFLDHGQSKRVFQEKEGTLAFQAPECLQESDSKFSLYPTDVWALGVTLYQLKYGDLPFYDTDNEKLIKKIINDPIELPVWEKDEDFKSLIRSLLVKDPLKRMTIKQICRHPWITNRGKYEILRTVYDALSPRSKNEKVMSKLVSIDQKSEDTGFVLPLAKRSQTTHTNYSKIKYNDFKENSTNGDIDEVDLEPISELKIEDKLGSKPKSTKSGFGSRVERPAEDLDRLINLDADLVLNPILRSATERREVKRNNNPGDVFGIHSRGLQPSATRFSRKPKVTFQENIIDIKGFGVSCRSEQESKEEKSRVI